MASQDQVIAREHPSWRGSNRIASIELEDGIAPATNVGEDPKHQEPRWRKFLSYVGPGFLVAMAYIDPGNHIKDPERKSHVWLGTFDTAEDVVRVYDMATREFRESKAKTNFPLPSEANHQSPSQSSIVKSSSRGDGPHMAPPPQLLDLFPRDGARFPSEQLTNVVSDLSLFYFYLIVNQQLQKYMLLWVIIIGMIFALLIQSLAANLGVTTGKHLAQLCKAEYPKYVKYCLWLTAETAVIAADIPEVIGTAFALNILFHIPIWAGVLLTGCSTLLLLGLQRYGIQKLELLMASLVCAMASCYFVEIGYVKPPAKEVLKGLFIPKINGNGAMGSVIALLGAIISPHNLFLHSALVLSRKTSQSVDGINRACRYFLIETGFNLFVALLINVAVVSVSGTVCFADNLSQENANKCNNLTLDSASFLLKNVLGKSSSIIYAIALLASGQSSTITGTYAGQFIMQGFLDLNMKKWIANLMTRSIAIAPSLVVSIISGSAGAGRLIIIASMILSFDLPFVLIPLLKFSSSKAKMGPHRNSIYIMIISWILGLGIIGINVYYLSTGFVGWLIHNNLPKIGKVFIGLIVFPLMAVYILAMIYLSLRKDTVDTFIHTTPTLHSSSQTQMENGEFNPNDNSH